MVRGAFLLYTGRMDRFTRRESKRLPVALFVAIGFVCFTGVSAVRELYRRERVHTELATLETRVHTLTKQKNDMSELIERLQSPSTLDREARLRLRMQKSGERVFVLRGDAWEAMPSKAPSPGIPEKNGSIAEDASRTNPERWLRFFFVHPSS